MFHYTSLIIPLLILLPNALFLLYPPKDKTEGASKGHILYQVAEGVGRVGVIAASLFYPMHWEKTAGVIGAVGMLLSLGIYLYCWVRYLVQKSSYSALYMPLLKIPAPMAWSPVLYFLFAALLLQSPALFISAIMLAAGHIPASLEEAKRIQA